jgi:hypothetical protein
MMYCNGSGGHGFFASQAVFSSFLFWETPLEANGKDEGQDEVEGWDEY